MEEYKLHGQEIIKKHSELLLETIQEIKEVSNITHTLEYDGLLNEDSPNSFLISGKFFIPNKFKGELEMLNEIKMLDRIIGSYHKSLDKEVKETKKDRKGIQHIIGDFTITNTEETHAVLGEGVTQQLSVYVITKNIF